MSEPRSHVAAVVLAAGRSTRMGRDKALLPAGSITFVRRLVETLAAAGAAPVLVVTAPDRALAVGAAVSGAAHIVVNPLPERGQLSSLQCGLAALPPECGAALITPVDLPFVDAATAAALVRAWRSGSFDVLRPVNGGRHGHPVLVTSRVMQALRRAGPDETTRTIIAAFAASSCDVPVDDRWAFTDLDTPDEYIDALRTWKEERREE